MEPLTDLGVSVATEVSSSLLAKIRKHVGYLIKFKDNLKNLKDAVDQLDAKRRDVSRFVKEANSQFKDVGSISNLWIATADELHENAGKISSANNVSCVNLRSRYSFSKNAWELTQKIKDKVNETNANDFYRTYDREVTGHAFNIQDFMAFESRSRVLDKVLEALKDDKVTMCSMCGMGGMGKTMLAKKLVKRVEEDHLFDKVAYVTVSQIPKLEEIQKQIVGQLGLKLDEETARKTKLFACLSESNTLLILDDVWSELSNEDFEMVGIPLGNKRCKIVFTSRNEDECTQMGSQKNFRVGVLEQEEAWDLFRQNAGNCIENSDLKDKARMIADECNGLPIAIVTIAKALKDKPIGVWRNSLRQLQISKLQGITGMDKVYSRIRLSYDLLEDKEAQTCFLLCCLFPEDSDISVEDLVFCGKGVELFKDASSISEARDIAETSIYKLKKTFLLLDGEREGCAKMHDIMRDFAISVCSGLYLVRHSREMTKWPEAHEYENCRGISLMFEEIKEHPVHLRSPNLERIMLRLGNGSTELPFGFFEEMKKLKVLFLTVPSILQPLSTLKELRTLVIVETLYLMYEIAPSEIRDLLGHGNLKNLEILAISSRRSLNDFPTEVGLLCNLKFLDFYMVPFRFMPPGVLSELVKLEELLLPPWFDSWGCKEKDGERVNASLDEIESLPITRLIIGVKEGSSLGEKFVKKLERFDIFIGPCKYVYEFNEDKLNAAMDITDGDESIITMNWIISLLKKTELLGFRRVRNLRNLMSLPRSLHLKKIVIRDCREMDCLITTTMQEPCFTNLTHIKIFFCHKLKYVFPLSVATQLMKLQSIYVRACDDLEEIFSPVYDRNQIGEENVPEDDVLFPCLRELELEDNPKLRCFYGGNEAIELPCVEKIEIVQCKAFSYGSLSAPNLSLRSNRLL